MLTNTSLSPFEDRSRSVRASVWKQQEGIMQLGFIGTGEITSSIVTGLSSSRPTAHSIWLSPRNSAIAKGLANRFHGISVASCNQEVLDHSDTIVIAVRPSVARHVLSELRFRPDHQVVSLISALALRSLSELVVPAVRIARAVPLPSTANRLSPTAIYPPDQVAFELFAAVGTVFPVERESEFDAICATTATIAFYFAFKETIASWLEQQGVPAWQARDYVARLLLGVTTGAVEASERSFQSLAATHATSGGINEQFLKHLVEDGLLTRVSEPLDAILHRIGVES
jgi:pyrroline-5-carboxylate reductase